MSFVPKDFALYFTAHLIRKWLGATRDPITRHVTVDIDLDKHVITLTPVKKGTPKAHLLAYTDPNAGLLLIDKEITETFLKYYACSTIKPTQFFVFKAPIEHQRPLKIRLRHEKYVQQVSDKEAELAFKKKYNLL